ncbi:MAG: hypothetical protein ACI8UG_001497 [Gammaproteobacteria bacterium]|jgi:hypothetical protein
MGLLVEFFATHTFQQQGFYRANVFHPPLLCVSLEVKSGNLTSVNKRQHDTSIQIPASALKVYL